MGKSGGGSAILPSRVLPPTCPSLLFSPQCGVHCTVLPGGEHQLHLAPSPEPLWKVVGDRLSPHRTASLAWPPPPFSLPMPGLSWPAPLCALGSPLASAGLTAFPPPPPF